MIKLAEMFNQMQVYSNPGATAFKKEAVVKVSTNEDMSDSEIKKMHKKYKDTGELPPHLKKMLKGKKDFEKKFKVKNIVVPGLEWMSDIKEETDYTSATWSSKEAKSHMDSDVKQMSKILGKASYHIIKIMMDGVKSKKYDALDIIRGIDTGAWNRTHEGERPFMKLLWRKVRTEFRRYLPKGKLRK